MIEISLPTGLELLDSSLACTGGPPVYFCTLGELAKQAEGSLTLSLRSTRQRQHSSGWTWVCAWRPWGPSWKC